MNRDLLNLLLETDIEIRERLKVCDRNVGDYVLELQTALKFIEHAVKTADRLYVFKALQKAYDILETDEDVGDDDSEPSLPERIKQTLDGLHENTIRCSDLKNLTKFILKEIAPVPEKPISAFHTILQKLNQDQENNPIVTDIDVARKTAHENVDNLFKSAETAIQLTISKVTDYSEVTYNLKQTRESIYNIIMLWAKK